MANFGSELRQQRNWQGVQLEDISAATRITVRYLRALEEEAFGELPGGVFNKGIVRSYARFLNLDEHATVAAFMDACRRSGVRNHEEQEWGEFAENVSNQRGKRRNSDLWKWAGVLLMLLVVTAAGVGVWWWIRHYKIVAR
jgi:cytoskeleton protein RodZ